MKNFLTSLLPALALLTLGGCAGTSALSTTEDDGVYYSSQDRTTRNATASVASAPVAEGQSDDEISNPDYATAGRRTSTVTEATEYYDDDYAYSSRIRRFHQPYYRGFGYGYNDFVFADPFWYGGPSYYGSGFYDPFYGPSYGYGGFGGSYVNINIGFGSPWGWGYNPWRYGRGYGGYGDYYGGGYGGYGGLGYGGYGGFNNYYNVNNYYGSGVGTARNVRYGPRTNRSAEAGTTAGRTGTSTSGVTGSRSRAAGSGIAAPTDGRTTGGLVGNGTPQSSGRGRARATDGSTTGGVLPEVISNGRTEVGQSGRGRSRGLSELTDQQVTERETRYQAGAGKVGEEITNGGETPQPAVSEERGRRWRTSEATGAGAEATPQPQYSQPRRSRYSDPTPSQNNDDQSAEQPVRRQRAEAPQRTYEAPQRTSEAPQRTYEQPSRSEAPQRSYSEPSRSSSPSNDGGGNSGGGRGRGRD